MAPLSLKIILDEGAVTRTVKFDSSTKVLDAHAIIKEKVLTADDGKECALFLTSADDDRSGIWLEPHRPLDYYMLRDGDSLLYLQRTRNLRVRMLDGSLKTLQIDESKNIGDLMRVICGKIGITNHDEYGLCQEESMETEEKDGKPATGTLTLKRKTQQRERDAKMEQLSKKLKTDDNVEWLDQHKTLREMGVDPKETLLLKRRLFYSDRNIDSRDPVQLNLLYVQTRDAILNGRHPVTEDQAADCKIRWIHIRDVYRRILRKSMNNSAQKTRAYKYGTALAFMRPFYRDMSIQNEEFESDDNHDDDHDDDHDDKDVGDDIAAESDESDKPVKKRSKPNKKKKKRNVEVSCQQPSSFDNVGVSELDPRDPIDAFLLSIGATLKSFTPYHLNLAKSKIFSVVQEHDLQQIVQRQRHDGQPCDVKIVSTSSQNHMYSNNC